MTECPNCGMDISDSYQPSEPDVGVVGGWYCYACDLTVGGDGPDPLDDDVQFGGSVPAGLPCAAVMK